MVRMIKRDYLDTTTSEDIIILLEAEARGLLDGPAGTNPEYERALCELIARVQQHFGSGGTTGELARDVGAIIGAASGHAWRK